MPRILYVEFSSDGPFGEEAAAAYAGLADDIASEPELIWKVWTEDPTTSTAGGVYLFTGADAAARYLDKHTKRLASFGITDVRATSLDVNEALSGTTRATLTRQ